MKKSLDRLQNFPISFFAVPLGLTGFTLALQKAEEIWETHFLLSNYFVLITIICFVLISTAYFTKSIVAFREVKKEFTHPIKLNFFPIFSKIFLLLSIIFLSKNIQIAEYLWIIGAVLQVVFTLIIVAKWIHHNHFHVHHLTPAWFIPVVGCIIVPISGAELGYTEISWFFFSIGFLFWFALFSAVINRIIFHDPIPEKLLPTLFILFAPPAIGFISSTKLMGEIDPFGKILLYFSLFLFLIVLTQFSKFCKIEFYLSWWAYSFPLAAISVANMLMYKESQIKFFEWSSAFFLICLIAVMIILSFYTLKGIFRHTICVEEK